MARLGCRQPPGRTGTDPGGPLACGRARTCLPLAVGRPARWPARARPPPAVATTVPFGPTMTASCGSTWRHMW